MTWNVSITIYRPNLVNLLIKVRLYRAKSMILTPRSWVWRTWSINWRHNWLIVMPKFRDLTHWLHHCRLRSMDLCYNCPIIKMNWPNFVKNVITWKMSFVTVLTTSMMHFKTWDMLMIPLTAFKLNSISSETTIMAKSNWRQESKETSINWVVIMIHYNKNSSKPFKMLMIWQFNSSKPNKTMQISD